MKIIERSRALDPTDPEYEEIQKAIEEGKKKNSLSFWIQVALIAAPFIIVGLLLVSK